MADTTTERISFICGQHKLRPDGPEALLEGRATSVLLVIGAGPYGIATAARAIEKGIETVVLGRPFGFWMDNMPEGMYLRSGPDWHLDASGIHTFEAYLEERGIDAAEIDPIPIAVFLDYARWFQQEKDVVVDERLVMSVGLDREALGDEVNGHRFEVRLADGEQLVADAVVAAPGVRYFQNRPDWSTGLSDSVCSHTCDLVHFNDFAGARVLIVGGRQSAYEWAALIGEHGAERVDIVHRHEVPRFERVSWRFANEYVDRIVASPGWWRSLPASDQETIARKFWEVGRLTLEWWLTPRLQGERFHRRPGTAVVAARTAGGGIDVKLSDGTELAVDRIVLATGYKADLARVPYLSDVLPLVATADGFPLLDDAFQTSLPGLFMPGFTGTRDFGPFFGFTKGCPAAADLVVRGLSRR
jgi:cation diffusion facilitator CzcD-associated flavoprotein CzcO